MEERKILMQLKENYDYKISGIDFLRDSGGTAYIVNSGEQKFLLKIVGRVFQDTISQSVDVMCYLSRNGFPVPAIIETKSGMPMLEVQDEGQKYLFVLYEYIDGKEPDLSVCGERVGELVGRLHKLLPNYNGNLLETADGTIYFLDFDTICVAPRMFDVTVMCDMTDYFNLQIADIQTTRAVCKNFLAGYAHHIHITDAERESFNDWIVIRHFQLQATIVEIFGIDCIDNPFIDGQLQWIESWERQLNG